MLPTGLAARIHTVAPVFGEFGHRRSRGGVSGGFPKVAPWLDAESWCVTMIGSIWKRLPSIDNVGVSGHIFDLGTNSRTGLQLLWRFRTIFHRNLPSGAPFQGPTVCTLVDDVLSWGEAKANPGT